MQTPLIRLDFKSSKSIVEDCADTYYNMYDYDVFLEFDEGGEVFIGKGRAVLYLYDKAINDGFDILDAFDDNHHEGIYDIMFDGDIIEGTKGLKAEWVDLMCDSFNNNILVSDRLELLPEYRHKGYGKIIRQIKRVFFSGSYGIEVLHSFPLQFEMYDNKDPWRIQMDYEAMLLDATRAHASLNQCYLKSGYTQYQDSEYFYRFPSVDELSESEWNDDEFTDIDFSNYEEDYYSSFNDKSFKQVDSETFITTGKCKLVSKEEKNQSIDIDLEKVYCYHPELFHQWNHYEFDLSPIGLSKHVKVLTPDFSSNGIRFAKSFLSQNQYFCALLEILDTLSFDYCGHGNKSYTFGRNHWSRSNLQELKRKGLLVFRLLEYGTRCYVDVILSQDEAYRRGITKSNLCDNYIY